MNWQKIKLIFTREMRDQLRDRRTLFMIAVLPMLLYPLMGISFFQVLQFMGEHPTRVYVVGARQLDHHKNLPKLFSPNHPQFASRLFTGQGKDKAGLIEIEYAPDEPVEGISVKSSEELLAEAIKRVQDGQYDAVLYFPPDFVDRLDAFRASLKQTGAGTDEPAITVPSPQLLVNTAREASKIAQVRLVGILERWKSAVGDMNLQQSNLRPDAARPFELKGLDVARPEHKDAALWSKILPFVLIIWAMTGAFYPAIDLCAGEKERGTLETLLSSPAERGEIVVGKLLTVMIFSMATSVLNLLSMGLTGAFLVKNLGSFGPMGGLAMPPVSAVLWLLVALVPVSALFSGLCLALAALARSSKEGQYYLMPLIMITLPLMILPMAPGVELTLGNALVPLTGLMLLLREMIGGNYHLVALYAAPVIGVTLLGCYLSIRWAIDQFNSEAVLFRESERLDVGLRLKHLFTDRQATPSVAMAIFCGLALLLIRFFTAFMAPADPTSQQILIHQTIILIPFLAVPVLLMTGLLTRNPRETLLLRWPRWSAAVAAVLLAVVLNPVVLAFSQSIAYLYPMKAIDLTKLAAIYNQVPFGAQLLFFALLPAVCEELAFRGFILSGLRHMGHKWRAIVISSVFFGATHMILQQSLSACLLGIVIGYLAVQTGSLLPCMLFHVTHNALLRSLPRLAKSDYFQWLLVDTEGLYHPVTAIVGGLLAISILFWFRGLPAAKSSEESLQEEIDRNAHRMVVSTHG